MAAAIETISQRVEQLETAGSGKECYFLVFDGTFRAESPTYAPRNRLLLSRFSWDFTRRISHVRSEKPGTDRESVTL
eukprot:SAG31_NODE_150_length_22290_cov_5.975801_13_plen_77_part_00